MAEEEVSSDLKPKSGGNPYLDQMVNDNPEMVKKMWEAGTMSAPKAYQHLYGESLPWSGISEVRKAFIKNHADFQAKIMGDLAENYLDPAYGMSVGAGAKQLGISAEEFAHPEQMTTKTEPQSVKVPNQLVPQTFDINQLQPGGLPEDSGRYTRDVNGQPQPMSMGQGERTLELPDKVSQAVDPMQPMTALQRADVNADIKRRGSPWSNGVRGKAANAAQLANDYFKAVQTYGPDDPRTKALGAQAGVLKSDYQGGEGQRLTGNRANLTEERTREQRVKADFAYQHAGLVDADIRSRIAARTKNAGSAQAASEALTKLRDSQRALNEGKLAGTLPDQKLNKLKEEHLNTQRRFIRDYVATYDPKDLLTPEGQDRIAEDLAGILNFEDAAGMQPHVGMFRQFGKDMGIINPPEVGSVKPPVGKAPTKSKSKAAPAAETPTEGEPHEKTAAELQKEAEGQLGDLSKLEGKTLNNGKYVIRKGKVELVK